MPLFTKSLPSLSCGISEDRVALQCKQFVVVGKKPSPVWKAGRIFSRGSTFLGLVVKQFVQQQQQQQQPDVCDDDHDRPQ